MYKVNRVLYILNDNTYIHCELESFIVSVNGQEKSRIPSNLVSQIVIFGNTTVSNYFIKYCSEHKILVSYVTAFGNYYGGLRGKTVGNVLLRQRQYRLYEDQESRLNLARNIVLGKALNSKKVLEYFARDAKEDKKNKLTDVQKKIEQFKGKDFKEEADGILLNDKSRKHLLELWVKEKEEEVYFPLYKKTVPKKLLPYLQAQLLSQFIRGDIDEYPPWTWNP